MVEGNIVMHYSLYASFKLSLNYYYYWWKRDVESRMPNKRKHIDLNLITSLREMGLSWTQIQQHPDVDVSKSEMSCWRVEVNFVEPRQPISNNQLDAQVANLIEGQPRRGGRYYWFCCCHFGVSSSKKAITG